MGGGIVVWGALGTAVELCLGRERALPGQCPSCCVPVTSLQRGVEIPEVWEAGAGSLLLIRGSLA